MDSFVKPWLLNTALSASERDSKKRDAPHIRTNINPYSNTSPRISNSCNKCSPKTTTRAAIIIPNQKFRPTAERANLLAL